MRKHMEPRIPLPVYAGRIQRAAAGCCYGRVTQVCQCSPPRPRARTDRGAGRDPGARSRPALDVNPSSASRRSASTRTAGPPRWFYYDGGPLGIRPATWTALDGSGNPQTRDRPRAPGRAPAQPGERCTGRVRTAIRGRSLDGGDPRRDLASAERLAIDQCQDCFDPAAVLLERLRGPVGGRAPTVGPITLLDC